MDYYCSTKFTDLQVSVQSRLLYNCCKAYPERVDLHWLEKNPGRLFHTNTMIADRELMLEDKSCASCHHGCYKYEEQGLPSKRSQEQNSQFIPDTDAPLKNLQISLSTDCNMTCMYCGPEWSSSWQKDIKKNGAHELIGFKLDNDNFSDLWAKIKQKSRSTDSRFFDLFLKEIKLADGLESISILGGEPLLNNQLEAVIDVSGDKKISITTGLGVSHSRLSKLLKKIKNKRINFSVSGETTGKFFELIRYGTKWEDFKERVKMIEDNGHKISFISTISNLSVMGFSDFHDLYSNKHKISISCLTERAWMMPHVLDPRSKNDFINSTQAKHNLPLFNTILQMIKPNALDKDRINMRNYIDQFASRRSVDLSFIPKHFLDWCGNNPN